jgi:ubiquinone/menaquinone biosynthesis C-methylase UbiE
LFKPEVIVAVDIDEEMTGIAAKTARNCRCQVVVETSPVLDLGFPSEHFDMIFCHQLLHHTSNQEDMVRHFYRLLTPGGLLLVGESCRAFIRSFPVRVLFNHPIIAQKTPEQYVRLIKSAGFEIGEHDSKASSPWWSRWDLGVLETLGVAGGRLSQSAEVLIAAKKP